MKYQYTFLGLIFSCLLGSIQAQNFSPTEQHYFSDEYIIPNFVEFSSDQRPSQEDVATYLGGFWKGKDEFDLRLKDSFEDQQGEIHNKYVQTYKGVDIEFAEWIVHLDQGKVRAMSGKLITEYPNSSESSITEAQALQAALGHIGAETYKWELPEEETFLKNYENDPNATYYPKARMSYMSTDLDLNHVELKLCYVFNIYAHEPMSRQEIFVDANSAEIILSNSLIHTSNVPGTAHTGYSGVQTITTDSFAVNRYRLRQTALGNGVNTYDLNNATTFNGAVDFVDSNNIWNQINAQRNQFATDAHWGAEQTYQYFNTSFGRNSIDNNGFALNSYVHYGNNFVNAFWNGQYMTYGDGSGAITPLTALDIAGHEIAHGLTTFSANLIYQRESGALNESFSDIFGAAIEFYARPNNANWSIGEDIGTTIRSMSNPKQFNDPDTYDGTFWLNQNGCVPSNQNDLCGVHINSGVQNYWFHLLSTGGSGTNDNGDPYTVANIGIVKAAAISYRNLTVYLGRNSNYSEARFFAIRSAIDLYGACSPEVEAVTRAWYAVGVGANYINSVISDFNALDTVGCNPPFSVSFNNESVNGINFNWSFGDGNTSTLRSPTHVYNSQGLFDVSLIVDGGACGVDTLTKLAYIDIDSNNSCAILLNNGNNPTQTDCIGKLFDSGGGNGDYGNNQLGNLTISPTGASSVTLTFNAFDVEAGTAPGICDYDFLEVYDGSSMQAPLIGRYCNNVAPPTTITSTRGAITLRFRSDAGVVLSGFDIDWSCNFPSAAPLADFEWNMDSTCTGEISFRDLSTEAPTSWTWDLGDGSTSSLRDPSHTYSVNGDYTVSLISTNSFGTDTVMKSNIINVNRPAGPSVVDDTTCVGQTANLSANGSGRLDWYTAEFGGAQVNSGSSFSLTQPMSDTTFWVEDYVRPATQFTGEFSNNFGTGGNYNGDQYLVFDVFNTMVLTDVFVYANGNGLRTIELRDNNGVVLQSKTLNISNGLANVDLDFLIEPGTDYQLGVDYQGSGPDLYRNSSGASYPYTVPGLMSIKRSSATSNPFGFYYFFYYWRVKEPDCVSPRFPVTAKQDPNCGVTSIDENTLLNELKIYPNPAQDLLQIQIPAHDGMLQVELWNVEGKRVKEIYRSNNNGSNSKQEVDISDLPNGIYLAKIQTSNQSRTIRLVVL